MWVADFLDKVSSNDVNQAIDGDHNNNTLKASSRLVQNGACRDTKKIGIANGNGQRYIFSEV